MTRPRLLQVLDESLTQETLLVLVCGPAGYGKTTLVGDWVRTARQSQLAQFAWLTLERGDDDLTRFLTYFISALQHLQPGISESVLKLLHTHKPVALPALATLLINELSALPERIFLVLDDYHLLSAEPIQNFISFLVDHQPPQLCLILVIAALALLLSMLLPSRSLAAMFSGAVLVISYMVSSLAFIDQRMEQLSQVMPYRYFQTVLSFQELNLGWLFSLLGISLLMVLASWLLFLRRNIRLSGEGSWKLPLLAKRSRA